MSINDFIFFIYNPKLIIEENVCIAFSRLDGWKFVNGSVAFIM